MEDTGMSASTEASPILILTINDCPGMRVVRVIGPVYGTGVRSRNIVGNFLGGVRAIFTIAIPEGITKMSGRMLLLSYQATLTRPCITAR